MTDSGPKAAPTGDALSDAPVVEPRDSRLVMWVLVALVAAVPLASGDLTVLGIGSLPVLYDSIALPRMVLTAVGVLTALAAWFYANRHRMDGIRTHPALLLLLAVAILGTASAITSVDSWFSVLGQSERLEGAVVWWIYAALFAAGLQAVDPSRDLRPLAWALVAAGAACALLGLMQFAGFDPSSHLVDTPSFDLRRAYATFGNPDFLAGLLVLALPAAVVVAASERAGPLRIAAAAAAILIAGGSFATFSRGGWLACLLGVVLAARALWRSGRRPGRSAIAVAVVAVLVAAALAAISLGRPGETNLVSRLSSASSTSGSVAERLAVWQTAVSAAARRPMLGWGPDAFLQAFRRSRSKAYVGVFGRTATINNAHDWPLQVATALGIPAALLLTAAVVSALVSSAERRSRRWNPRSSPLHGGLWSACVAYVAFLLSGVTTYGASVPFFIILGALCAPVARRTETAPRLMRPAAAGFALLAVAAAMLGVRLMLADNAYLRSRVAFRLGSGDAVAPAEEAASGNPTSVKYARGYAEVLAARFYAAASAGSGRDRETRALFDAADRAFSRASAAHPQDYASRAWHAALLATAAHVYGDVGLAAAAKREAGRAMALDAVGAEVRALALGRTDEASILAGRGAPGLP